MSGTSTGRYPQKGERKETKMWQQVEGVWGLNARRKILVDVHMRQQMRTPPGRTEVGPLHGGVWNPPVMHPSEEKAEPLPLARTKIKSTNLTETPPGVVLTGEGGEGIMKGQSRVRSQKLWKQHVLLF